MDDMSKTKFSIAYDGPALEDGSMDVRELAPALFAVGQLFEAVSQEINGDTAEVKVSVHATREGCFEVLLNLDLGFIRETLGLLGDLITAKDLVKYIIGGGAATGSIGLVGVVRWLKGRNPTNIESLENKKTRIEIDGEYIVIETSYFALSQNPNIRQAIEKLIAQPLKTEGIESVEISDDDRKERVEKGEYKYFEYRDLNGEILHDNTLDKTFSIIALSFNPNNKWRLSDGVTTYSATINDQEFLEEVAKDQKSFAKNDILVCKFRMRQFIEGSKLKSAYSVEKVIEHRQALPPTPLIPTDKL